MQGLQLGGGTWDSTALPYVQPIQIQVPAVSSTSCVPTTTTTPYVRDVRYAATHPPGLPCYYAVVAVRVYCICCYAPSAVPQCCMLLCAFLALSAGMLLPGAGLSVLAQWQDVTTLYGPAASVW
eukprot:3941737-Rhodomonas_salina.10